MILKALLIPFGLQAVAMFFDEFYFHHRRRLPKWEAYGHPLDTLSTFICYGWIFFSKYSNMNLVFYLALSSFSCLLITKDEWVHQKQCCASEQWLHSFLFILHPINLGVLGWLWSQPQLSSEVELYRYR